MWTLYRGSAFCLLSFAIQPAPGNPSTGENPQRKVKKRTRSTKQCDATSSQGWTAWSYDQGGNRDATHLSRTSSLKRQKRVRKNGRRRRESVPYRQGERACSKEAAEKGPEILRHQNGKATLKRSGGGLMQGGRRTPKKDWELPNWALLHPQCHRSTVNGGHLKKGRMGGRWGDTVGGKRQSLRGAYGHAHLD